MDNRPPEGDVHIIVNTTETDRLADFERFAAHLVGDIDIFRETVADKQNTLRVAEMTLPGGGLSTIVIESHHDGHLLMKQSDEQGMTPTVVSFEAGNLSIQYGEDESQVELDELEKVQWASLLFSTMQLYFARLDRARRQI